MSGPRLTAPPLAPGGFAPTRWSTAEDKAAFGNTFLTFVARDFPRAMWTRRLYGRLHLTFGFIAHFDMHGFWEHHLAGRAAQAGFIAEILAWPCHGDPAWTFSDVERAVQARLRASRTLDAYRALAAAETEAAERAALARLREKYDGVPPTRAVDLPVLRPPPLPRRLRAAADDGPTLL